jgi:hypothetical protein
MPRDILRLPASALMSEDSVLPRLREHLGVAYAGVLSAAECAAWTAGVYEGRSVWTPNFGAIQFTLGRAWYTHLEQGQEKAYFKYATQSDENVRRHLPGMQDRMTALLGALVGDTPVKRAEWCGPGVHIFPIDRWVAKNGGDVHYDTEGLSDEQIARRAPALTAVLMLQPAERGGGLRLWDQAFVEGGDLSPPGPDDSVASESFPYAAGDLLVIDSYRLHQIEPFTGARDRISITAHTVQEAGRWEVWF